MKKQSGQILLITVMFLAMVLTMVLSISFTSITETQITKLEEEDKKTLAIAEAASELALKKQPGSVVNIEDLNLGAGFTGQAIVNNEKSNSFITPLLSKYKQYTFYLSYPKEISDNQLDFSNLTPEYKNKLLNICSSNDNTALFLTLIKEGNPPIIKNYAVNPPANNIINNGVNGNDINISAHCPSNESFSYYYEISSSDIADDSLLLIVKAVNNDAKIGFKAQLNNDFLPLQGKQIISEAKSPVGVAKKIQFFQSYPQIPAEFFITSF